MNLSINQEKADMQAGLQCVLVSAEFSYSNMVQNVYASASVCVFPGLSTFLSWDRAMTQSPVPYNSQCMCLQLFHRLMRPERQKRISPAQACNISLRKPGVYAIISAYGNSPQQASERVFLCVHVTRNDRQTLIYVFVCSLYKFDELISQLSINSWQLMAWTLCPSVTLCIVCQLCDSHVRRGHKICIWSYSHCCVGAVSKRVAYKGRVGGC